MNNHYVQYRGLGLHAPDGNENKWGYASIFILYNTAGNIYFDLPAREWHLLESDILIIRGNLIAKC